MQPRNSRVLRSRGPIFLLLSLLGLGSSTSCLVRTRKPDPQPVIARTAALEELLSRLKRFETIRTLRSTVNLQLSFITDDEEKVKEYSNVRGLIAIERPAMIRVIAQVPVVRTTAFEMVSNGKEFRVHLPTKNRFLIGSAELAKPSEKRIENVRPEHFLDAMLIDAPRQGELAFLENVTHGRQAFHVVTLVKPDGNGHPRLTRKFWFDRIELNLTHQEIFDANGDPATIAYYREWSEVEGVPYPNLIFMDRRKDGYRLQVRLLEATVNKDLAAQVFEMEPPPGVKVERIGEAVESANGAANGHD